MHPIKSIRAARLIARVMPCRAFARKAPPILLSLSILLTVATPTSKASAQSHDQRVEIALGQGGNTGFRERLDAVQSLYKGLSPSGAEALYQGIIAPAQPQGLPLQKWAALYNDVFNAINQMSEPLENYPERLIGLISEEARPAILRDYALQHLLSHTEFKLDAEAREKVLKEIEPLASAATETSLPATYLLGIWQPAGKPGYPTADAIGKQALSIAANPEAFTPNRISAIQICGQLGYKEALPLALEIAGDGNLKLALRSAAIATIGNLSKGSEDDRRFLTKLKRWGHPRLQYAAQSALSNF